MTNKGDVERRLSLQIARDQGPLESTEELAKKHNVSTRTIKRDLKFLRENDIHWIEEVVNETLISLYREAYNGYFTDRQTVHEIRVSDRSPRAKEVEANLVKMESDMLKEQIGLLLKGPAVWYLQRIQKSREIVTVPNQPPPAIFGEVLHNTHIDLDQLPLSYTPPTIEKDGEE